MKIRNRFAGALLGIAMLGGIGAGLAQPALAQDASATPAAPAVPAPDAGATPAAPDTSTTPSTPAAPDTGSAAATPATPAAPDTSATPVTPAAPDAGTTPTTPDAGATPAAPDTSTTPASPNMSAAPTAPATPDASAAPATPAPMDSSTPAAPAMPTMASPASVAVPLTQLISPTPGDYSPAPTLSTGPINTTINYHALTYSNLCDNDLQVASSMHLSDRQIAKILKLAKVTDMPFNAILRKVADGQTFPTLCYTYGVSLAALRDVSKEIKQVDDYESAEAATGAYSFKHASVLGRGFRDPGSEGSVLAETPDLNQPLPTAMPHG